MLQDLRKILAQPGPSIEGPERVNNVKWDDFNFVLMCEHDLVATNGKYLRPRYCCPNTVYTSILQPAPGRSAFNNTGTRSRTANCLPAFLFAQPDAMRAFAETAAWTFPRASVSWDGTAKSDRLRWTEHVAHVMISVQDIQFWTHSRPQSHPI